MWLGGENCENMARRRNVVTGLPLLLKLLINLKNLFKLSNFKLYFDNCRLSTISKRNKR